MDLNELLNIHEDTCNSCREVMVKKNSDYTGGKTAQDIFANFRNTFAYYQATNMWRHAICLRQ